MPGASQGTQTDRESSKPLATHLKVYWGLLHREKEPPDFYESVDQRIEVQYPPQ